MKTVLLCEGSDDLWFIAYYINSKIGWEPNNKSSLWSMMKVPTTGRKQEVLYMCNSDDDRSVAICAVGGQDRFEKKVEELFRMNNEHPEDPIESIIIFRDRDEREPSEVVKAMESWFENVDLTNREISVFDYEVDGEYSIALRILPVVIPLTEAGAVETLLLEAIEDEGIDGAYVACKARTYVEEVVGHGLTMYLQHQRDITKAKFSAALAIKNPDHSTKGFQDTIESISWESSLQVENAFAPIVQELSR